MTGTQADHGGMMASGQFRSRHTHRGSARQVANLRVQLRLALIQYLAFKVLRCGWIWGGRSSW